MTRTGTITIASIMVFIAMHAYAGDIGTSGAQFLRIGVGAKASALGETAAVTSGAQSVFYNPAGLSGMEDMELSLSQVQWIEDINYSNLAFARKTESGAFGVGINYLSVPPIDKYDNSGQKLSTSYQDTDMALTLGYSRSLSPETDIGLNLKYISSKLESYTATAFAADLGAKYKLIPEVLTLGAVIQNLGTEMKYIDEGDPLPLNFKVGGSYFAHFDSATDLSDINKYITFFADGNYMKDTGLYANLGAEFMISYVRDSSIVLRGGYRTNTSEATDGLSAGLGFNQKYFSVDYAYAPMGDLGTAHRFSLTVRFGG